jgi:1,4-dihydroxy-2-naphthoyl-CoA hydrolase
MLCIDPKVNAAVGLDINANHVRGVRSGIVTGTVRPLHIGRSTHVWDIRIENEDAKLVCVSRLTVAVIPAHVAG